MSTEKLYQTNVTYSPAIEGGSEERDDLQTINVEPPICGISFFDWLDNKLPQKKSKGFFEWLDGIL